jgi:nitrite reductase (cytochrome c-552)
VAYNEPRGHAFMIKDQIEIDASRVGAGGVCLTCKTPYAPKLEKDLGLAYYKEPFLDVLGKIPKQHRELGVACVDCHQSKDMSLIISREFTLGKALAGMGVDKAKLTHQDMRSLVCAQCHVTYNIPKDENKKSVGVYFPWQGSTLGNITIENIIKQLRTDPSVGEWKQTVTGFKLAFIRHPEYELFSNNSVHWKAGAACADCHMPYTKVGSAKVSDHRVTSPLKADLKACQQCHSEAPEWLRQRVYDIQDRVVSLQLRAGYGTATAAKLFEMAHKAQEAGTVIDQTLYDAAKDTYLEAFYRTIFIGAENSVGFHNPAEATRVLGDAVAFAGKSEGLLRQALAKGGVDVPAKIDLELTKYLKDRGKTKQQFKPEQEVKDPFGIQQRLL